jgi:DNA-binding transcriptional ArsR family regulator
MFYRVRRSALAPYLEPGARLPPSLRDTLAWAQARAAAGEQVPLPLSRLAALRGLAPRTLREHLARLEQLGLVSRGYRGNAGIALNVLADPLSPPGGSSERTADAAPPTLLQPRDRVRRDAGAWDDDTVRENVAALTGAGVYAQPARALARKPWITPGLITAWVDELRRTGAVRNLAAVLVHTLEDPERCLPPPAEPARWFSHDDAHHNRAGEESVPEVYSPGEGLKEQAGGADAAEGLARGLGAAEAPRQVRETRERVLLTHAPAANEDCASGLSALWASVHAVLAERLPPDADRLWLRRARPLCLSDGVLIVAVPSTLGAEWLNLAGAPRCYDAISEAAGRRLLLRFVPAGARDGL